MYDGLTPLFDQVAGSDLTRFFKSERFGVDTAGPGTPESVPRPGVTIIRDKFNVPHVFASTYDGGIWAAGWIVAEDRGLLLQQARYNARVAAIDAPGLSALGLISGLQNFQPSAQTEAEIAKQTQVLQTAGPEGRAVLRDIDTFISGINDYLDDQQPLDPAMDAQRRLRRQRPQGAVRRRGGRGRGPPLAVPRRPSAAARAVPGEERLRRPAPVQEPREPDLGRPDLRVRKLPSRPKGSVILDPGSYQPTPAAESAAAEQALPERGSGQQHPDDRRGSLEDRVPADGRRPADRLLLPRPDV